MPGVRKSLTSFRKRCVIFRENVSGNGAAVFRERNVKNAPHHSKTHVTLARPGRQFVQTERATHEAWARLILQNNRSAQLMHVLCSQLDDATNAVVASQKTLAKLMGCSDRTVRNALTPLIEGQWIQVVQLGMSGSVNAYVINSTVAWTKPRDDLHLSAFHAKVIADAADQSKETLEMTGKLRTVPLLYPGETQLPTGPGLDPPAQPSLEGLEPEIPSLQRKI